MQILITFALDAEFAPWRKIREFRVVDPGLPAYETSEGDAKICVVLTGVRCARAWDETAINLWGRQRFEVCVSSGLAGGLKPDHHPGDVLVARGIRDFKAQPVLTCDSDIVHRAIACGAKMAETFYTSDRILLSAEEKCKFASVGDAVDTESWMILNRARDAALAARYVAIRAISDTIDEDLPIDFNRAISVEGEIRLSAILKELARHPQAIPRLVKFGFQSRRAAQSLAHFLDFFVSSLAQSLETECLEEVSAT